MKKIFSILILLISITAHSQVSGNFIVNGDLDKFYPVKFSDGGWVNNAPTNLILGRSNVHTNASWRGSLMATFNFHVTSWGNGSNFIDADVKPSVITAGSPLIAGWQDVTGPNAAQEIIIWLRGGGTTYYYKSNYAVNPVIYDGVQNALPFNITNGGQLSFKTAVDTYATTTGTYENRNAYFNANVGIGTTVPTASLEINAPAITGIETLVKLRVSDAIDDYLKIGNGTNANTQFLPNLVGYRVSDSRPSLYLTASTETTMDTGSDPLMTFDSRTTSASIITRPLFSWDSYGNRKMILTANGSLGIGTTTTGSHKLAVEGSIGAREIKVQATGWSDFVFKKDYKLPTLEEVENHIKEKGHLENIPSEEEVLKNGINLGEMNSKLLQKIEELTLYLIEMKKENIIQNQEIDNLKKQLSSKKQ
ncbi:hypothetical protein [Flavobacterium sp. 1355]|uniref:hypothetical protein n=1 Tax=Flavobacterium sp. 1355 TaxID=2806571 RepID=UPI001AEAFEF4|nr:hypothetical protein [Flavobacterium sp. 1355]MBP1221746.1 hypothetical protein [Flavobacterium sp. 1355]